MATIPPDGHWQSECSLGTLSRPFVLALLVLTVVLAVGVPAVAGAPQAGPNTSSNHILTSQPASSPANTSAPNASQAKRALVPGAQGTSRAAKNATLGVTNNATAKTGPDVNKSTKVTAFAKRLNRASPKQAKKIVKNNPKKTAAFVAAFKRTGISKKTIKNQPKKAARTYLGAINAVNALGKPKQEQSVQLKDCPGWLHPLDSATCQATNALFGGVIGGIVHFIQGVITGIVNLIVGTPAPKHNGHVALVKSPTNPPWTAVHSSWQHFALPLGMLEWALMVLGVLFSQVYISNPAQEVERRELWHRSWKVLFGVLGSWIIGSSILWLANAVTLTVAPNGQQVAHNLGGVIGNIQAIGMSGLLLWFFDGILFIFLLLMILAKIAVVFTLMWALPVLIPLAAFDVGPLKIISAPARGLIDMFIPFAFLTLPTALVLRVGYVVLNGLNGSNIGEIGMTLTGANGLLITGFWIVATVAPLFVFSHAGAIKGFAAGALGAATVNGIENIGERVQDAKDRVKSSTSSSGETPPNVTESTDITDGSPIHRANDGTLGGPLVSGRKQRLALESGKTLPATAEQDASSLDAASVAPMDPDPSDPSSSAPTTADTQNPELPPGPALSGGDRGGEAGKTGTANGAAGAGARRTATTGPGAGTTGTGTETGDEPITSENVNRVYTRQDLPSETKYTVGYEKDGKFQPLRNSDARSREWVLDEGYNQLSNTRAYQNKTLLLRSEGDGSVYDPSALQYEKTQAQIDQMRRDSANDVMNS